MGLIARMTREKNTDNLTPVLSVIIVNYNGKAFLSDCLDSVQRYNSFEYEVIVVDNASIDGSCEYIEKHYPNVRLIASNKNLGFSGGNNLGTAYARGEIILLLNNDTRLLSSLLPAVKEFDRDEKLGVLGCRMFYSNGGFQPSFGYEHTPLRLVFSWVGLGGFLIFPRIFKRVNIDANHYSIYQHNVAWVSGAFLMTRRDLWEKLGGLDEKYFMYIEDVDYCKRVREAGYRVVYTPYVEIIHYQGAGCAWIGENALRNTKNSYLIYTKKFYGKCSIVFLRTGLCIVMFMRAIAFYFLSLFSKSIIVKKKARAFMKVSFQLLIGK